jgi:hypothetical protein
MSSKQEFFTANLSKKRLDKAVAYLRRAFGYSRSQSLDFLVSKGIAAAEQEWKKTKKIEKPSNPGRKATLKEAWTPDMKDE